MKKRYLTSLLALALLVACGEETNTQPENVEKEDIIETSTSTAEQLNEQAETPTETAINRKTIDTSVFEYAKEIEVTDGREPNKHITLRIDLADDASPGMGTNNVLQQAYDFLQQEDIAGANTVTIFIRIQEIKIVQFKITPTNIDFSDEDTPMAKLVINASEIEHMTPEVKEFGETLELW